MLRAVRRIADRVGVLPLRIGVNRGPVFAGDFGPPFRRTFSVKGDAVNLAARVMGKAAPGEVLVTEAVLDHARSVFDVVPLDPFTVKGKAELVRAARLGSLVGARSETSVLAPLVGRAAEMGVLTAALDAARERRGTLVDLVGEPGIGKSRLVSELLSLASDVVVVTTQCEEYESSTPYHPFRRLLREVLGLPDAPSPEALLERLTARVELAAPWLLPWLPLIGVPLDVRLPETPETRDLDEQFRRGRLEEAVAGLLDVTLPTSTVLVLDDAHQMDQASASLLNRLVADLADRPWLVLVTRRDSATGFVPGEDQVVTLRPGPLDAGGARALVGALVDDAPLTEHDMEVLAKRAGGNPLFLRGLVHAAIETGGVEGLPSSVEELVTAQIDRLAPSERTVLRFASVLGSTFSESMLREVLAGHDLPTGRASLRRLGYFLARDGGGRFRFQHELIRDTAYEGLPYRRRVDLHAQVGAALERSMTDPDEAAEQLSMHFFHAAQFDKAWHYARTAGERASAKDASAEAAELYGRAVEAARRLPSVPTTEVVAVLERLGDARMTMGRLREAGAAYRAARRMQGDGEVRAAQLMLKEGRVAQRLGNFPQTARWLGKGLRILANVDGRAAAETRSLLASNFGICRYTQGRYAEAHRWCGTAVAEARHARSTRALARAYSATLMLQALTGLYLDLDYGPLAVDLYGELGDLTAQAHCTNNLGVLAIFQGRWDRALELLVEAEHAFVRVGADSDVGIACFNRADILVRQGRLDEAQVLLVRALRAARASGDRSLTADVIRELGRAATRAGQLEEGLRLLEESRAEVEALGARTELVDADGAIAENLVLAGRAEDARALAAAAVERARHLHAVTLLPTLNRIHALALLRLGLLDDARQAVEDGLRDTDEPAARHERGFLLAMLAGIAELAEDPASLEIAASAGALLDSLGVVAPPPLR
jgi:tetratricopeptide (TPR) repeat protein